MSAPTVTMSAARVAVATPEPEATPARYRHDPYGAAPVAAEAAGTTPRGEAPANDEATVPAGTLHTALWGRVTFVPYPDEQFDSPPTAKDEDGELVRVFIGQLPYFVTDMQLAWLCYTFGGGHVVSYPERIMKRQASGERLPTGCVHAYCSAQAVAEMADGMHKRMLVDDTGVWHAQSQDEWEALAGYVSMMKRDKTQRFPNRPYDTIVVQFATSSFVPAAPMPLTEMPVTKAIAKARAKQAAAAAAAAPATPPPAYSAAVESLPPQYAACLASAVGSMLGRMGLLPVVAADALRALAQSGGDAAAPPGTGAVNDAVLGAPRDRRRRPRRRGRAASQEAE